MEAEIGIIGGSGLYSLLDDSKEVKVQTKYGAPSDSITIGTIAGRNVVFLPRHSRKHTIPPHKVPYRANIDALRQLGVNRIIATNAVGSLDRNYKPGELAIFDQFINATHGRHDTYYDEEVVAHVSSADPYCLQLRNVAIKVAKEAGIKMHDSGTVVVINGPRFSTRAESKMFKLYGAHMINMTQYPEVILAREKQMCYLGIGLVTDYDSGLEGDDGVEPVTADEVAKIFDANVGKAKKMIHGIVAEVPEEKTCSCSSSMEHAIQTKK